MLMGFSQRQPQLHQAQAVRATFVGLEGTQGQVQSTWGCACCVPPTPEASKVLRYLVKPRSSATSSACCIQTTSKYLINVHQPSAETPLLIATSATVAGSDERGVADTAQANNGLP
jgi:hypothetical protein